MVIKEFSIEYITITSYVAIYYVTVLDHELAIGWIIPWICTWKFIELLKLLHYSDKENCMEV